MTPLDGIKINFDSLFQIPFLKKKYVTFALVLSIYILFYTFVENKNSQFINRFGVEGGVSINWYCSILWIEHTHQFAF